MILAGELPDGANTNLKKENYSFSRLALRMWNITSLQSPKHRDTTPATETKLVLQEVSNGRRHIMFLFSRATQNRLFDIFFVGSAAYLNSILFIGTLTTLTPRLVNLASCAACALRHEEGFLFSYATCTCGGAAGPGRHDIPCQLT